MLDQPPGEEELLDFWMKYEDSENIKTDRVSTVVFNLHKIKCQAFSLFGTPGRIAEDTPH